MQVTWLAVIIAAIDFFTLDGAAIMFADSHAVTEHDDQDHWETCSDFIRLSEASPPIPVPPGHVGPVILPGTGRMVWWTGRVAIGLRHQAPRHHEMVSSSALWLQDLMLGTRPAVHA